MKREPVYQIPATERDALMGDKVVISDDIIRELTIQCKDYYSSMGIRNAQARAMDALKRYGSDRVYTVPVTDEQIQKGDYGFRLKDGTL
jgi:hypothetical protein